MIDYTHLELHALSDEDRAALDYMCPNCVTPWKCNGPHIPDSEPATPPVSWFSRVKSWLRKWWRR